MGSDGLVEMSSLLPGRYWAGVGFCLVFVGCAKFEESLDAVSGADLVLSLLSLGEKSKTDLTAGVQENNSKHTRR